LESGCDIWLVPYNTSVEQIKNINPDGILLSNGPGNPADNPEIINNLKDIIKLNLPIFGIGLGHQLLALAHGFAIHKLKYGHRGANHPVKNLIDGRVYVTNQNHGYTVEPDSIDKNTAQILFENVNDKTCEGLEYKDKLMFSTEFHPETRYNSERNTSFLFDRFIQCIIHNA
jgi:carbamoyl-phosphate synthase small subunit